MNSWHYQDERFSKSWIKNTTSVKKSSFAWCWPWKKNLGADAYNQEVVSSSPIGRGLAKMTEKDKQTNSYLILLII